MRTCMEECLNYLKFSRTEKEVRNYLYEMDYKTNEIEDAIAYAKELKYIDDYDYAYAYVNDHVLINKWGPIKIKLKLKEKGIPEEYINNTLMDNEKDIMNNLYQQFEKKANSLDLSDQKDKNKIIRHLLNKGYNYSEISEVLNSYE